MAPTAHAADWLAPASFAGTAPASARTAIDNQGNVTAVWQDQPAIGHCQVQAVDRASGVFSSVQVLSGSLLATDCQPDFASDAAGDAVAVWTDGTNAYAATRTAGGAWSSAHSLDAIGVGFSDPKVAMNASGDATAVWLSGLPVTNLRTARWSGGSWSSAGDVTTPVVTNTVSSPAIAVDSTGNARALWESNDTLTGNNSVLSAARGSAPSATFPSSPTTVVPGTTANGFDAIEVKPDGLGNWLAIWRQTQTGGSHLQDLTSAFATGSGGYVLDGQVISSHTAVDPPGIAFGPNGTATIVWSFRDQNHSNEYQVLARNRPTAGLASGSILVTQTGNLSDPVYDPNPELATPNSIFLDPQGGVTIVYAAAGSILARSGTSINGLNAPVSLGSGTAPAVGGGAGYVSALWPDGSNVDLRVFDAVPPSTPVISGPSAGNVGDVLTFSATSSDDWGLAGINWTFGDGTAPLSATGSGAPVTHAFGGPGTYTVTAEGVDGAGNKSSPATSLVTIKGSGGGGGSTPPPSGLPNPVAGVSANLQLLSGDVLVKVPGSDTFVPLTGAMQLPVGTIVDASKGSLQITISDGLGHLLTGVSSGGQFVLQQKVPASTSRARGAVAQASLATLLLYGGNFRSCKSKRPQGRRSATAARKRKKKKGLTIRQLLTSGSAFQTQGKYAAAVVRGTQWVTADRCDGTLITVRSGKVLVRDLVLKRSFLVKAHHQYLARARRG